MEQAEHLWAVIKSELADRGCFNGIDDDVFEELESSLVDLIDRTLGDLPSATQVAEAA